jgi:cell division septation protein DedD
LEVNLQAHQIKGNKKLERRANHVKTVIFIIVVLLLACTVAFYFYYPVLNKKIEKINPINKAVLVIPNKTNSTNGTNSSKNISPTAVNEVAKKDTAKVSDLEKFFNNKTDKKNALAIDSVKKVKPSRGESYFIIAGSFKTFRRATVQAKQLQKEGYKAEVLQFSEDLYRVSLGEYGEKEEALVQCNKILATKGAGAVWVLGK